MSIVVPYVGEVNLLKIITGVYTGSLVCHLFSNNIVVDRNTVLTDLVETSSGSGYVASVMTPSNWTFATVSNITTASFPTITFNFPGSDVSLYGYYVTLGGNICWCESFIPAINVLTGGTFELTPSMNLQ